MHKLTEIIHILNDVWLSNGQVKKATNKKMISTRIVKKQSILNTHLHPIGVLPGGRSVKTQVLLAS